MILVLQMIIFISGMICGFLLYVYYGKIVHSYVKKARKVPKMKKKNPCRERLKNRNDSYTEYTCILENEDVYSHICDSREKEDEAYRYAKQ